MIVQTIVNYFELMLSSRVTLSSFLESQKSMSPYGLTVLWKSEKGDKKNVKTKFAYFLFIKNSKKKLHESLQQKKTVFILEKKNSRFFLCFLTGSKVRPYRASWFFEIFEKRDEKNLKTKFAYFFCIKNFKKNLHGSLEQKKHFFFVEKIFSQNFLCFFGVSKMRPYGASEALQGLIARITINSYLRNGFYRIHRSTIGPGFYGSEKKNSRREF